MSEELAALRARIDVLCQAGTREPQRSRAFGDPLPCLVNGLPGSVTVSVVDDGIRIDFTTDEGPR